MRGKLTRLGLKGNELRITPAGAGKTTYIGTTKPFGRGSPPQVRGKHVTSIERAYPMRITPADAGKTRTLHEKRPTPKDHPRGCGENGMG